ncbi:MAG: hypothetical protein R3178_00040, partial [Rhodothermales bacterium]|nr:hypothetical protein [Rhodothermales bacterium]
AAPASAQDPVPPLPAESESLSSLDGAGLQSRSRALESSTTSIAQLLSFHVALDDRQSVGVGTELLKLATFYFKFRGYEEQPDWKFKAVPITLSYERLLCSPEKRIVPVVGVGLSYYFAQLRTRLHESVTGPQSPTMPIDSYVSKSFEMGWGAQVTGGIRARLTDRTFLQLQGRYRVLDGFGLSADELHGGDLGVFDFAVGIGFSI